MICSRWGTNIDDNVTECEYCGLKFKTSKPQAMFEEDNINCQEMGMTDTCLYIYSGGTAGNFSNSDPKIVYDTDPQYIKLEICKKRKISYQSWHITCYGI